MDKILISAASSPAAASFSKYLRNHNYYTIGISDKFTNYANVVFNEFHVVPTILEPEFITSVLNIEFDFYLPWIDEEIELLLTNKYLNPEKYILPNAEVFNIIINKNSFYDWCVDNNLCVLEKTKNVPAFIRQSRSRGSRGALHINKQSDLDNYLNQNFISQVPVPKYFKEYTVDVFSDHEGNMLHASPRIRLDAKNISFIGVVEKNKIADRVAKILSQKLRIPGMWNFQIFIKGNKYYLVEINTRLAGSVIFTILAGFPFQSYLSCLINKKFSEFNCPGLKNIYVERYFEEFVFEL